MPVGETLKLPKFSKNKNAKIFTLIDCYGDEILSTKSFLQELELRFGKAIVLEVILLPKNKNYVVKYVNSSLWEAFLKHKVLLETKVSEAKQKKATRQKNFKNKFSS